MIFVSILALVSAISISIVAAFYSIIGLTAIFPASVLAIVIMGTVLEVGKIVTAVWLHTFWHKASLLLKSYLTVAVIILMFITSLGIFGFLSKAHIQQSADIGSSVAQIERISNEIIRIEGAIVRAEQNMDGLERGTAGGNAAIQAQIDREQARVDSVYARLQPLIDAQQEKIRNLLNDSRISEMRQRLAEINAVLEQLNTSDVASLQRIIGATVDGRMGPQTRALLAQFTERQLAERDRLSREIASIEEENARRLEREEQELKNLRQQAETQTEQSLSIISALSAQLGQQNRDDLNQQIAAVEETISNLRMQLETLITDRFALESNLRILEAEVGPIRYVAEMVYGPNPDKSLLEQAIRWLIILIVIVFDPLAICLVLAGISGLHLSRKTDPPEPKQEPEVKPEPVVKVEPRNEEPNSEKRLSGWLRSS